MKSWIIFGFGLILGVMAGAFLAAFLLFDDLTENEISSKKPFPSIAPVTIAPKTRINSSVTPIVPVLPPPSPEAKPPALAAEAVDLDTLPPADEGEKLSAKQREDAADQQKVH